MLRALRSPPTDGCAAVEFRLDDRANLISTDRGGHESFGELFAQIRKSLGFLRDHGGLHLSAADGGTTMPELARCVQVRDVVRGSAPSGRQSGPQVRRARPRIAANSLPLAGRGRLSRYAMGVRVAGVFPKQEERRTKATPEPPPRGHDVAHGRRSLSGARRQCCHRVARIRDPRWRYFGRQPDAHASFVFFRRRFHAAIRPTPFSGVKHPALSRVACRLWHAKTVAKAAAPRHSVAKRSCGTGNIHPTSCGF